MGLLTINAGSSSVRLGAFELESAGPRVCASQRHEHDGGSPAELLAAFAERHLHPRPELAAHRVVHGGVRLTATCRIDDGVEAEIERLAPLAPLHNPAALAWVHACRTLWGADLPQFAVFDTAFHAKLPEVAATYALPHELMARHGLRRYGFHGLAHQALWSRWSALRPEPSPRGRVISFQLGAGCSASAIEGGAPRDTTMGFSPLEGLVMATRSGDVDAALVTYLQRAAGLSADDVERLLNQRSGLLGLSGRSGDMRELLASDDPRSRLAVDLYTYRARKVLGAYLAVLGGADAVLFGGGVGENAAGVRAAILDGFGWAGIRLDAAVNAATVGTEGRISEPGSPVEAWVIPVDEAQLLAQEALAALSAPAGKPR